MYAPTRHLEIIQNMNPYINIVQCQCQEAQTYTDTRNGSLLISIQQIYSQGFGQLCLVNRTSPCSGPGHKIMWLGNKLS